MPKIVKNNTKSKETENAFLWGGDLVGGVRKISV